MDSDFAKCQQARRGFFIIDRSVLEDAYVPPKPPATAGTFDWQKLIQYRVILE